MIRNAAMVMLAIALLLSLLPACNPLALLETGGPIPQSTITPRKPTPLPSVKMPALPTATPTSTATPIATPLPSSRSSTIPIANPMPTASLTPEQAQAAPVGYWSHIGSGGEVFAYIQRNSKHQKVFEMFTVSAVNIHDYSTTYETDVNTHIICFQVRPNATLFTIGCSEGEVVTENKLIIPYDTQSPPYNTYEYKRINWSERSYDKVTKLVLDNMMKTYNSSPTHQKLRDTTTTNIERVASESFCFKL